MQEFDFKNINIFMKFSFRMEEPNEEKILFLYSNTKGIENLTKVLNENSLFSNLLTPTEVLTKMTYEILYNFSYNQYTGVNESKWIGKQLVLLPHEQEDFNKTFLTWKNQLEMFLGKDNLFQVFIPKKELQEYIEKLENEGKTNQEESESLFNYIEKHRLSAHLTDNLNINPTSKKRNKI